MDLRRHRGDASTGAGDVTGWIVTVAAPTKLATAASTSSPPTTRTRPYVVVPSGGGQKVDATLPLQELGDALLPIGSSAYIEGQGDGAAAFLLGQRDGF